MVWLDSRDLNMPRKLSREWLLARLRLLNASELEKDAELSKGRLADVRRGKAKLREDEIERIRKVLTSLNTTILNTNQTLKTYAPKTTSLVLARPMMRDKFFKKHFGVKKPQGVAPGYEVIKDGEPTWINKMDFEAEYFEYKP